MDYTKTQMMDSSEQLDTFKSDICSDADVVDEQRDKANEDMRFVNVTGGMWEGFLTHEYDVDRVKLELDLVSNYLQRFIGEWNLNRVGVDFKKDDASTQKEDSELLNGIYRADFRRFSGKIATDNAVNEAATCGVGAFKLASVFSDESDPENDDMQIEWRPIHNAYKLVFWDQAAQRIDKKDARHCTVLKEYTQSGFEGTWPDKTPSSAYVPLDRSYQNRTRSNIDFIYVATRYEVIKKRESVFVYRNLQTSEVEVYSKRDYAAIKDDLEGDEFREFIRERKVLRQHVEKTVFSGDDILEETKRIAGKWIPIIPFYGFRAYVDGAEWYRGLVRKLKDAARLFNMQISQLAENAASVGQEVPIFDPDQMENLDIQNMWADKNNKPYLLANSLRDQSGNIVATGPIGYNKPAQLDASTTALVGIVPSFIQGVTGGAPQDTIDPDASGKAINALIKRENLNTQVILDNIETAVVWSGEVYQSMAAELYNTERVMQTIGKDGRDGEVALSETILDKDSGRMVEINTLTGKRFRAYADAGPQYETLREQTVEDLKGMLSTLSTVQGGEQYIPVLISSLLENISGVGLDPVKEFNRRLMLTQGLVKPEGPEEEAMVASMQQEKGPSAQEKLTEAAAQQQLAEARNLDSDSVQNVSSARKYDAQTVEIMAKIEQNNQKIALDAQKQLNDQQLEVLKIAKEGLS